MKSTIHEHQKNNLKIVSKNLKNIGLVLGLTLTIFSCTPNDPTDPNGNPNGNPNANPNLLQIKSSSTGNASNLWNLGSGTLVPNVSTLTTFTNLRTNDPIVSSAGLLSQTTMKWQSSAYDKMNKKYAVSLAETIVIYDMSSSSVPTPTTYNIAVGTTSANFIMAMEYVNGDLYVIQNNEIKKFASGVLTSIGSGIMLPAPTSVFDTVSNMTSNGNIIYFTLLGKLYSFDVITSTLSSVSISGWSADISYNGLEYCTTNNRLYTTKRYPTSASADDFVTMNLAGVETTVITGLSYTKDFSRISSAVDQATNIYYLSSSNGFGINLNTVTEINLLTAANSVYGGTSGYAFGLQYKD